METFKQRLDRYYRVADLRGVAPKNPVVISEVYNDVLFKIVVAFEEPSNNSIPLNVIWMCADQAYDGVQMGGHPTKLKPAYYYKLNDSYRVYRRSSMANTDATDILRNTWSKITTEAQMFAQTQYYDLDGVFLLGELTVGTPLPEATSIISGTVRTNKDFSSIPHTYVGSTASAAVVVPPGGGEADCNSIKETTALSRHFKYARFNVVGSTWYTYSAVVKSTGSKMAAIYFFDNLSNTTDDHVWTTNAFNWSTVTTIPPGCPKDQMGGGVYFYLKDDGYVVYRDACDLAQLSTHDSITALPNDWYLISVSRMCRHTNNNVKVGVGTWKAATISAPPLVYTGAETYYAGSTGRLLAVWDSGFNEGQGAVEPVRTGHNIVVADNDYRLSNPRYPNDAHFDITPPAHPLLPAEEFLAYNDTTVVVRDSDSPLSGNVLITSGSTSALWRALVPSDIESDPYHLSSLSFTESGITALDVNLGWVYEDATSAQLSVVATYAYDNPALGTFTQAASPVTWSITAGTVVTGYDAQGKPNAYGAVYTAAQISARISVNASGVITFVPTAMTADSKFTIRASFGGMNVSYDLVAKNVVQLDHILVTGATVIVERQPAQQYTCTAYFDNGTSQNVSSLCTWSILNQPGGSTMSISASGLLTVTNVAADVLIGVQAAYTVSGQPTQTNVLNVTAQDVPVTLSSIAITGNGGNTNIYEGATIQYTCTATYSDGSTQNVTTSAVWSLTTGTQATLGQSTGYLTVSQVNADATDRINATYTEGGTTKNATPINISILDNYVTAIAITSPSPTTVVEQTTAEFYATLTKRDGNAIDGTALCSWSSTQGTFSGNTLTAPNVTSNTAATVTASFTNPSGPVLTPATKNITITFVPLVLYPKYGTASVRITDGTVMNSMLTSQVNNTTSPNVVRFTPGTGMVYCYFAVPDTISNTASFQMCDASGNPIGGAGGWDGASWTLTVDDPANTGTGPIMVSLVTSGETHNWALYRTDDPALGDVYFKISYP